MRVERDSSAFHGDLTGSKIEPDEIGDPPGAVDDAIGLDRMLVPGVLIDDTEAVAHLLYALDRHAGVYPDPNPLGLAM